MKPVRQTRFNKGDGNCFNACIATLLDLPIDKVDAVWNETNWLKQLDDILHPLGYCYIEWEWNNSSKPWMWIGSCYMIASGRGPRGCMHAVIVHHDIDTDDGKHCVVNHWDPHPDEKYLETIEYVGVLFPHWEPLHNKCTRNVAAKKGGAGVSAQTMAELKEVAEALSGALQLASQEADTLKRQLEVLLERIANKSEDEAINAVESGLCDGCAAKDDNCFDECAEKMREWSLEKAKAKG